MARQRRPVLGIGIMLLAHKLYSIGMNTIPPVTLLAVIGQTLLYLGIINPPWDRYDMCLSGEAILRDKDYRRLFLSAVEHADDMHLYYNMASLILKGRSLERRYGSLKFLILLVVFTAATSLTYIGLVWGATEAFHTYSYMKQCAIGFSGVLFALKALTTHYEGSAFHYVHGIKVPSKYAVWAELFVIHILVPRSSFIGHLAGILVGSAYILGPLKLLVNSVHSIISGLNAFNEPAYTRSTAGPRPHQRPSPQYSRQQYGWNFDYGSQYQGEQYSQMNEPYEADGDGASNPLPSEEELRQRRLWRFQY